MRHEILGEGGEVREHVLGHNEIDNEDGEASEFIYLKWPGQSGFNFFIHEYHGLLFREKDDFYSFYIDT